MKAVILAGGIGERLRPWTEILPKPLLDMSDDLLGSPVDVKKPIMERCIENLEAHGFYDIVVSIGYLAPKIQDYFTKYLASHPESPLTISYHVEQQRLGTGGAVKEVVKKFGIEDDFILVWADNVANYDFRRLVERHYDYRERGGLITMYLTEREDVENFGSVAIGPDHRITKFEEKKPREEAVSNLINTGAFVIHPSALDILPEGVSSIERQCFSQLAQQGKIYGEVHQGYWYPTDNPDQYMTARKNLASLAARV